MAAATGIPRRPPATDNTLSAIYTCNRHRVRLGQHNVQPVDLPNPKCQAKGPGPGSNERLRFQFGLLQAQPEGSDSGRLYTRTWTLEIMASMVFSVLTSEVLKIYERRPNPNGKPGIAIGVCFGSQPVYVACQCSAYATTGPTYRPPWPPPAGLHKINSVSTKK